MRIVSKIKDYYDCIQATGQDRELNYIRDPKEVIFQFPKDPHWPFPSCGASYFRGQEVIIGFCGKIYPVILLNTGLYDKRGFAVYFNCHDMKDVEHYVENYATKERVNSFNSERYTFFSHGEKVKGHGQFSRSMFESYFRVCKQEQDKFASIFEDNKAPIFVAYRGDKYGEYKIVFNDLLNKFDFQKVFDPFTAYQEIYMYLVNQAVPQKPMPVIPDEMKIVTHGFDKFSFRRPKGGK